MPSSDTSTVPAEHEGRSRSDRVLHALILGLVGVLVVAALSGLLGVTTTTTAAEGGGYRIEVRHATVTRPGLATPFGVNLTRLDGEALPATVTLRVDAEYLSIFDENGLDPGPASAYADGQGVEWTFEIPAGARELAVDLDARLEPAVQARRQHGSVALIGDEPVVVAEFTTWVLP